MNDGFSFVPPFVTSTDGVPSLLSTVAFILIFGVTPSLPSVPFAPVAPVVPLKFVAVSTENVVSDTAVITA